MTETAEVTTRERTLDVLTRSQLFRGLAEADLRAVVNGAELFDALSGETLFEEGDPGDFLLLILKGSVSVYNGAKGREDYITLLGSGDTVGEMSLMNGDTRSASAMVIENARLARIGRDVVARLKASAPGNSEILLSNALSLTSQRLRDANRRFHKLAWLGEEARERVEQMRTQILSLISHELRTPLTVIKSSAQVLRRSGKGGSTRHDFIEKIENHSERLRLIIEDLITLSTLVARQCLSRIESIDLKDMLRKAIEGVEPLAAERRVTIEAPTFQDGKDVCFEGDKQLFGRALGHLLSNAVKFSEPDSKVIVELDAPDASSLQVVILDEGPGFAGSIAQLMQPFSQAEDHLVRENDGLGIGLTLARHIATAHGGALDAANRPEGGARVALTFPRKPPVAGVRSHRTQSKEMEECQMSSPRF